MVIRAKYEDGVFKPVGKVRLAEGTTVELYVPGGTASRVRLRDLGFAGMWKDRADIPDGITYVNRLRDARRF